MNGNFAIVETNERLLERMHELEEALDAVAVAFDWLAENQPKAMREMPGELFFPMWRKLNAVLNQEAYDRGWQDAMSQENPPEAPLA